MKTVAYYRNSIKSQKNSIDTQKDHVHKKSIQCITPIDEEFTDEDTSARKNPIKKRPDLQRLIKEIENDRVRTLFVYKRDRLARNVLEHLQLYRLFRKKQIEVIFAADNEPPMQYSALGELFETIIAGVNQQEGDRIVERLIDTKKSNFMSGTSLGTLPYGYRYDKSNDKIELIDTELKNVKTIFDEILTEKTFNENPLKEKALKKKTEELEELRKQKNNLHDFLERGIYDIDTFMERQKSLVKRKKNAEEEVQQLQEEIDKEKRQSENINEFVPKVKNVLEVYHATEDPEKKNRLLKSVLEKATYLRKKEWKKKDEFVVQLITKI